MAMFRIKCTQCGWSTKPHYSVIDCVKEKERRHGWMGIIKPPDRNAHDAAFGDYCPVCGNKTVQEYRWFNQSELDE